MYDSDIHSVRSGNYYTLTLTTPIVKDKKEPTDYNILINKPSINGVELVGNLSFESLGLPANIEEVPTEPLSNEDLDHLLDI